MNAVRSRFDSLVERWHALGRRDRILLVGWACGMTLLLLWFGVVGPLYRRIGVLEARVPDLEHRLHRMRAQSADIAQPGAAARPNVGDLRSALFGQLARRKLNVELRAISNTRVEMLLPELALPEALDLLDSLRRDVGGRVATLTIKRPAPTSVTVRIVAEMERLP